MESLKRIDPPKAIVTHHLFIAYCENWRGSSLVPYFKFHYNNYTMVQFVLNINVTTHLGYGPIYTLNEKRQWKN